MKSQCTFQISCLNSNYFSRYCFVQIKSGLDLDKVKEELSQVPFGVGKLGVQLKNRVQQSRDVSSLQWIHLLILKIYFPS